jgi:hypothetical protein
MAEKTLLNLSKLVKYSTDWLFLLSNKANPHLFIFKLGIIGFLDEFFGYFSMYTHITQVAAIIT